VIRLESFYENRDELRNLTEANSKEADTVPLPLDINWDFYRAAEDMGMMFCFISRTDGIDGYINCTIQNHHHHQTTVYCAVDCMYVRPGARGGILGLKLLKRAEEYAEFLQGKGVVMVLGYQKVDISPIAKRLGYEQSEIIYRKVIK